MCIHHHMDQLVDFLWFDRKRYWELSAVTEISWSSVVNSKALYNAMRSIKFIYGFLKLPANTGWLTFSLNLSCSSSCSCKGHRITALQGLFWKAVYLGYGHLTVHLTVFVRSHKSCCTINKMDCFQEPPEYILSEYWKSCRLSSFVGLCPPVCHQPKL